MARSAIAHSIDLMVTGFSSMLSVQDASHGAGQTRPVTSGKLLVECRLRAASSQLPLIDEVVPVGDLVVDRAARRAGRDRAGAHAIGHAAIHAARGLGDVILLRQRQHEFAPMAHALGDRLVVAVLAFVFEKAGDLAHCALFPRSLRRDGRGLHFVECAAIFDRHDFAEFRIPGLPVGQDFGRDGRAGKAGVARDQVMQAMRVERGSCRDMMSTRPCASRSRA